jgi:hypothetical protein
MYGIELSSPRKYIEAVKEDHEAKPEGIKKTARELSRVFESRFEERRS